MSNLQELSLQLGAALKARKQFIALAESCTGGGLGYALTEVPGSSEWFDCGFVTYSNSSKTEHLNISPAAIAQYGAVSEEIAAAMAYGASANSDATYAIATTGIAGPTGEVPGKPVGTVCFAWKLPNSCITERRIFSGDRHQVRAAAIHYAIEKMLRLITAA